MPQILSFTASVRPVVRAGLILSMMLVWAIKGPAFGETLSVETSARLQASLSAFLAEATSQDGRFSYLDRATARKKQLYPTTKHPIIVPFDGDYYLCMTMRDTDGAKVNVDFLLRPKSSLSGDTGYVVVDVFVDARHLMEQALKHAP